MSSSLTVLIILLHFAPSNQFCVGLIRAPVFSSALKSQQRVHGWQMSLLHGVSGGHSRKPIGVGTGELVSLRQVPFSLGMPSREVWVWLPPGYAEGVAAGQRFPVLYCQDGQNKMDANTSWLGADWNLGLTSSLLQKEGSMRGTIIVLIANAGTWRRVEYGDNIIGRMYVDWMCDLLKPTIDREFATLASPQDTFALGSSMGGSISFLATFWRPDTFGNACALSPMFEPQTIAGLVRHRSLYLSESYKHQRIYIDNGGATQDTPVPIFDARDGDKGGYWWLDSQFQLPIDGMLLALQHQGLPLSSTRLRFERFPGARHNERAWRRRVRLPLTWMLSPNVSWPP